MSNAASDPRMTISKKRAKKSENQDAHSEKKISKRKIRGLDNAFVFCAITLKKGIGNAAARQPYSQYYTSYVCAN